ncbi:MAG: hypothetical protein NW226_19985 [Microscillaceae bacterium]|nr:hypothetical protein [Microscillaceae bacterium]
MNNELFDLAKNMIAYTGLDLRGYAVKAHDHNDKIFFITYQDEPQYELWEVTSIWSVSTMEKELIKKHEEFYFALKHLLHILFDREMDKEFGKTEDNFEI